MNVAICYCVRNEEQNLPLVLDDAVNALFKNPIPGVKLQLVVVDNASTDRSSEVASSYAGAKVQVIRHETDQKYSGSYRTALSLRGYDYIAVIDGDYEHRAEDLRDMMTRAKESHADIVFGWRRDRADPFRRAIFSIGLIWISRRLLKHQLSDVNCGFRLFTGSAAAKISIRESVNAVGPELVVEARVHRLKLDQSPVQYYQRLYGSSIHNSLPKLLGNAYRFFIYMLRLRSRMHRALAENSVSQTCQQ